jgi:hypothetical protein
MLLNLKRIGPFQRLWSAEPDRNTALSCALNCARSADGIALALDRSSDSVRQADYRLLKHCAACSWFVNKLGSINIEE